MTAVAGLSSCNRFEPVDHVFPNSLYLDVSAMEETHPANFNSRTQTGSQELAVVMSYPADNDVTATVSVDGSLVDAYNHRYGTDYELMPSQYLDFAAAETAGVVVEHRVLPGRDGALGNVEEDLRRVRPRAAHAHPLLALAIAEFGRAGERVRRRFARDPVHARRVERQGKQFLRLPHYALGRTWFRLL